MRCVFYYGSGTVRINELEADLSEFRCSDVELNAPQTWALSQLKNWLTSSLGLDDETYTVGVHALWTKSRSNIYWYLRPIVTRSGCAGYKPAKEREKTLSL